MVKSVLCLILLLCVNAGAMNLKAQLSEVLFKKIIDEPNISFKDLIQFANEQEPVSVLVTFDAKKFNSEIHSKTACGTYDVEVPLQSYDSKGVRIKTLKEVEFFPASAAKPATIEWNSKTYLMTGPRPPYGLDKKGQRLKFIFGFPEGAQVPPEPKWWMEIVARLPQVSKEGGPFLIVESTSKGLRFSTNFEDYLRTPAKEVPGTREEYARNPFSKIFFYPSENSRIQVPQSCR